jgi:hypothetical protein
MGISTCELPRFREFLHQLDLRFDNRFSGSIHDNVGCLQ